MSCISASEISNETSFDEINANQTIIEIPEIHDYAWNGPEITRAAVILPDSQDALQIEFDYLNDGDTFVFDKDYHFNDLISRNADGRYVLIEKNNLIIDGNGHTIDAGGDLGYSIFKVTGNNVKIFNLTFTNSNPQPNEYDNVLSPVYWTGENGVISDCLFNKNTAANGGAITWQGNEGTIDNCLFVNNIASLTGGAINVYFCDGTTISNCMFLNSLSLATGEAIFIDRNSRGTTIKNIYFDNPVPVIDGKNNQISTTYFSKFEYNTYITDINVDLVSLIYSSIALGGINTIDNDISYYAQYFNDTGEFVFTLTRDFEEYGIVFSKDYIFNNITDYDFNELFKALLNDEYSTQITVIVNKFVNTASDYNAFVGTSYAEYIKAVSDKIDMDIKNCKNLKGTTKALNVQFTSALTINNAKAWNLNDNGFNVVNIDGHDSIIRGSFEDRNEDKWGVVGLNHVFTASNITITGFNTAIENMGGYCIFNNVKFLQNRMVYYIERDWGAAILNTGTVICNNCIFEKNYANNGGAIFNQGLLILENCTFKDNHAYGRGDNVCIGDGGMVIIDGQNITRYSEIVYFAESMSATTGTWITVGVIAASFIVGAVAGFFTANPAIGAIVGAAVGVALGSVAAGIIISQHYDVNYSRLKTAIILITGCTIAGAAGGFLGGSTGQAIEWINIYDGGLETIDCGICFVYGIPLTLLSGIGGLSYYFSY